MAASAMRSERDTAYRQLGLPGAQLLADQGGRGDAEAKTDHNGKCDQADADAIGSIGVGAVVGDDGEKRQEGQLHERLLEHRRCADSDQLPCARPVYGRRFDGLRLNLPRHQTMSKHQRNQCRAKAAAQGNPCYPQCGQWAYPESKHIGEDNVKQELNKRNHRGVMTSPVARSAVPSIILTAANTLNKPSQKMKLAASRVVSSSRPKRPAMAWA